MFGLMAIVLVSLTGAVVDYTSLEEKRNRAQIALDSAALALQPRIYEDTPDEIRIAAAALVRERLGDDSVDSWVTGIDIDLEEGTLELRGGLRVPMSFVRLIGIQTMEAQIVSEVTRKKLALEVAMVLDNSGSMLEQNRMEHLKNAAACAARTLFYDEVDDNCLPVPNARQVEDVRIGIVPFTMFVNVGPEHKNANWLDFEGLAPISNRYFEPNHNGKVDRRRMFASLRQPNGSSVEWAGCVIAREQPHDSLDTPPPTGASPSDPRALFTPLFAPDERDGYPNSYIADVGGACQGQDTLSAQLQERREQKQTWWGWDAGTYQCRTKTAGGNWGPWSSSSQYSCAPSGLAVLSTAGPSGSPRITTTTYSMLTTAELQTRSCKYGTPQNRVTVSVSTTRGPNAHCPTISILPLSETPSAVINRINAMVADGGTNIQQGAAWGWHVLSPDAPFEQGNEYDEATSKVMILMTDGENYNSWTSYNNNYNGTHYYGAYGHRRDGGLKDSNNVVGNFSNNDQMIAAMNVRTEATCRNAKAAGVTIYSIGLSTPNQATRDMLRNCATSLNHVYFPEHPTELNDVFASIANQLAALRISR